MKKKSKLFIFILSIIAVASIANFALAADFGFAPISNSLSLATGDPREIIGRIIQIALSFLGVIALILIMYAGFLWMTSAGDEDKISRAKSTLQSAVIGLIIILSAWAITTFILSRLFGVIGGTAVDGGNNNSNFSNPGMGAIGACSVQNFYPENGQTDVARNSAIIITFKEEFKIDSVCANAAGVTCACDNAACNLINPQAIRIYKNDLGDACASGSCPNTNTNISDVSVSVSGDSKTLVLTPLSYLGSPTAHEWYAVKITGDLKKKSDDSSMFKTCGVDYINWKFEVGTQLDLTPPQVVYGSIFPRPDNEQDVQNQAAPAVPASGFVTINECPNIYKASAIVSVNPIGSAPEAAATALNYQGSLTNFRVVISSDSRDRAQLFDANNINNLLGSADFDAQGSAKFNGYFILTAAERAPGNSWNIVMAPEQLADTLTIGAETYTFSAAASGNNNIHVANLHCIPETGNQIYAVLSGDPAVNVEHVGNTVNLTAKVAGTSGNKIIVSTTNNTALQTQTLKGGVDKKDLAKVLDKKDNPMNTVVQVNFSEPVNPLKVAGLASEVANYIKVVNYDAASLASSSPCTKNSDCRSYKCEGADGAQVCVGDYIGGKFLVSNAYKTVEFVSDNECGVNGCGEKIYCLPANSHLAVELKSADLKTCASDSDCLAYTPFRTCSSTPLGYKTCQNIDTKNYPAAAGTLNGIIDTAVNSFDGDRNVYADGPLDFYNDNFQPDQNLNKKDNYRWSFYVNDTIMLTPPQIESVTPAQGAMGVTLADPIRIAWNSLMMNGSLTTGSALVSNGTSTIEHKLINLKSSSPTANGYWVENDNIDTEPLDGEPDKTISWIKHTPFSEAMSYRAQAGSGIKDIYQNCYKPSAGVSCPVTALNPSCCFGVATSTLDASGNCQ
ncbi:MAG: pilin [Patescibacteria group bacterium]